MHNAQTMDERIKWLEADANVHREDRTNWQQWRGHFNDRLGKVEYDARTLLERTRKLELAEIGDPCARAREHADVQHRLHQLEQLRAGLTRGVKAIAETIEQQVVRAAVKTDEEINNLKGRMHVAEENLMEQKDEINALRIDAEADRSCANNRHQRIASLEATVFPRRAPDTCSNRPAPDATFLDGFEPLNERYATQGWSQTNGKTPQPPCDGKSPEEAALLAIRTLRETFGL